MNLQPRDLNRVHNLHTKHSTNVSANAIYHCNPTYWADFPFNT